MTYSIEDFIPFTN